MPLKSDEMAEEFPVKKFVGATRTPVVGFAVTGGFCVTGGSAIAIPTSDKNNRMIRVFIL